MRGRSSISRRQFLERAALGGAALSTPALLAACGGDENEEGAGNGEAAGGDPELVFYSVTHGASGDVFWTVYRNGLRDAQKAFGVDVKDLPLERFEIARYVELLEAAIADEPDGIVCTILDQAAVDEPLRRAIASGIPVIAVNVPDSRPPAERIPYLFYVGGNEEAGGRLTAQRLLQEGGVTRALCVVHEPGNAGLAARFRGYADELTKAGVPVEELASSRDSTAAPEQIQTFLSENGDVDAIFGVGPEPATFALQALDELGRKGQVKVSAYDLDEKILDEIKAGNVISTIDQQQYLQGWEAVNWLKLHVEHGFVLAPGVDLLTGPALVDATNADEVAEAVKGGFR